MLKFIIFCGTLFCTYLAVDADDMIGEGAWRMLKMERVSSAMDKFEFDIVQRKYNRSHDMFQGRLKFHEDLDEKFGARIDICKHVDGGCKQYMVVTDNSFGDLVGKYAASNFKGILITAGVAEDKAGFPVPAGEYNIEKYPWDWEEMPAEGPYGQYTAECCVMEGTMVAGCLTTELMFEKTDDDAK